MVRGCDSLLGRCEEAVVDSWHEGLRHPGRTRQFRTCASTASRRGTAPRPLRRSGFWSGRNVVVGSSLPEVDHHVRLLLHPLRPGAPCPCGASPACPSSPSASAASSTTTMSELGGGFFGFFVAASICPTFPGPAGTGAGCSRPPVSTASCGAGHRACSPPSPGPVSTSSTLRFWLVLDVQQGRLWALQERPASRIAWISSAVIGLTLTGLERNA